LLEVIREEGNLCALAGDSEHAAAEANKPVEALRTGASRKDRKPYGVSIQVLVGVIVASLFRLISSLSAISL
jgi:hypothetical protein